MYDPSGNLIEAALPQASVDFSYDVVGKIKKMARANGVTSNYTYDPADRLLSIVHSGGQNVQLALSYTYDQTNKRASYGGVSNPLITEPLTAIYNAGDQLVTAAKSSGSTSYVFDANGNMASATDANGTTTYTWDARNRLMTVSAPDQLINFKYDFVGNLVSESATSAGATLVKSFVLDLESNIAYVSQVAATICWYWPEQVWTSTLPLFTLPVKSSMGCLTP
jgi:YD repeat-containing protein